MPEPGKSRFLRYGRPALAAAACWALLLFRAIAQEGAPAPDAAPATAQPLEGKYVLWEQSLGLGDPNEPLCADFNLDGELELFLSDKSGRLHLVNARTGVKIWSRTLQGPPLLDPLAGQFTRPFPPEIAILREDGQLRILAAATGDVLVDAPAPVPSGSPLPVFHLPPSLVPAGEFGPLDTLLAVSEDRQLFRFEPRTKDLLANPWAGRAITSLGDLPQQALIIGRFPRGQGPGPLPSGGFAAVFPSLAHNLLFVDLTTPDLPPVIRPALSKEGDRSLAALIETPDGLAREILLSDPLGNVRPFRVNFEKTPPILEPIEGAPGEYPIATGCVPHRNFIPLVSDLDGDGFQELLLTSDSRVAAAKRRAETWSVKSYTIALKFVTPPALFFAGEGETGAKQPIVVIGEESGSLLFLDMHPDVPSDRTLLQRERIGPLAFGSILILDVDKNRRADILVHKRDGVCMLATTLPVSEMIAWPATGGSKLRAGGRSPFFEKHLVARQANQRSILENTVDSARKALEDGNYEQALEDSKQALSFNPDHAEARDIRKKALLGRNRKSILIFTTLSLIALILAAYLLKRFMDARRILRQTQEMSEDGRPDEILPAFQRYFRFRSGPQSAIARLAELCVRHNLPPGELVAILEKGRRIAPENVDITLTLARAYLDADNLGAEAVAVYEKACGLTEETGPFQLALGRIRLAAGETEEARSLLEDAYRQGCRDGRLYDALAEVYTRLNLLIPRHLRIFEAAAHRNPDNVRILESLARSYVNAGLQQDPKAQEVFTRLGRLAPNSVIANQELAAACFRAGKYPEARQAAMKALSSDPENAAALQVLGWCLWEEKDLGPDARRIYLRASERKPEDTQLLRVVAQILLENPKCEDFPSFLSELRASPDAPLEPAPARILRAIEANPTDLEFLSLAADAALRWGHRGILRRALELLSESKEITDRQAVALAEMYVSEGEKSPKCVETLSRAFEIDPDIEGLAELLGTILVENELSDLPHLDVFLHLFSREEAAPIPSARRLDWGLHLAKLQGASEQYTAMAETLTQVLSEIETPSRSAAEGGPPPADLETRKTEVQRLLAVAHSNLRNFNQAVEHYQSLLRTNPEDTDALIGLGRAYARMDKTTGDMHEAIQRARGLAPQDPQLNFACGNIAVERGAWNEAASSFLGALKSGGEYQEAVLNRLGFLARHYQGLRAIPVRWLLAQALLFLKRYEEAHEEIEAIHALNPAERERVLAAYDHILQNEPRNVIGLCGRARMLHRDGRHTEARQLLETAIQVQKNHEPSLRLMVEVYDALLTKQGENLSLRFALGQLCMRLGDYDRAAPCFQKTRRDPNLAQVSARCLAECFFRKKMYDLALQEFQNVPLDSNALSLLYSLGSEFETQGNLLSARMAFQRIYADDAGYKDVADRLNSLTQSSDAALRTLHQAAAGAAGARPLSPQDKNALQKDLGGAARQRYDLREEVGRGAMATVYRAHDTELDEDVALKILPESFLENPEALRRFRLEARSARKLSHDNIVRIHDIGEEMGRKYISMEFIQGKTLKQIIKSPSFPLPPDTTLRFARQIAAAMAYAHQADIIHRDLKPGNVMIALDESGGIEKGNVKITDFGIAKVGEHASHTITGAVVGTPLYMSPEQVLGKPCDRRADIYSYGVVLHELLTGKPPFAEGDLAYHHLHTEPPPLPPEVDPAFHGIVTRCLKKIREDRWNTFDEILAELAKVGTASSEKRGTA